MLKRQRMMITSLSQQMNNAKLQLENDLAQIAVMQSAIDQIDALEMKLKVEQTEIMYELESVARLKH